MKSFDVSRLPTMITLGYDGENNWRPNAFNCSSLLKNHPDGIISLWLLPHGETQAFPVALERDDNAVIWTPLDEEMTARNGALQIVCVDGTDVGKSAVVLWRVDESIVPGAEHPADVPSWATDTIERAESAADRAEEAAESVDVEHLEQTIAAAVEAYLIEHPVQAPVESVNGKTGAVMLGAADVHALPDSTVIPAEVTEQTVSGWGFTKNTGTYSKPSGGIPKTDLASDVQTSLGKADTALQQHQSLAGYATESYVQQQIDAIPDEVIVIDIADDGSMEINGDAVTAAAVSAMILGGKSVIGLYDPLMNGDKIPLYPSFAEELGTIGFFGYTQSQSGGITIIYGSAQGTDDLLVITSRAVRELPAVTASDNGKSLVVENGAWGKDIKPYGLPVLP